MDLSELQRMEAEIVAEHLTRGLSTFGVPEPMTLDEWASKHFYLSAESSYVEQQWRAWPFQRAIMACISNDDIYEIDWVKAARVGNTKIMLAAIGYFAEHKRRNQAIWQPTDDDRDEFVKTELDPMLRDVVVMQRVFPSYLSRHKDNTLQGKKFLGSMLHMRGGKAAKNYRRISVDVGYIDEADAFDNSIEKEGDPISLAAKRMEGATFPKLVVGSTPKLKGFSLVDTRAQLADERFKFVIPCPHCGEHHAITWGGKDEPLGFKFNKEDPDSVRHLCPHCAALISQGEYLAVWERGYFVNEDDSITLHSDGEFRDRDGEILKPPRHIAFVDVWTAYSPAASWANIVRDFIAAFAKAQEGDNSKLQAFWNTTLGRAWEQDIDKTDADELKARAESFPLRRMPRDCLLLLCGIDTQDNRLEALVWGYGLGGRMWTIDTKIIFGNPAEEDVWLDLEEFLFQTEYEHAFGVSQRIYASAIDSGGHHADAVYAFAHKHRGRRVHAIKGSSGRERSIDNGNTRVSYKWSGRKEKHGPVLWHVGTNLAKDRFYSRLDISKPGPGYIHFSNELSDEWFRQMTGEVRATRRGQYGSESRWTPIRKRIEQWDCTAYAVFLEERLDLWTPKNKSFWSKLEEKVQPVVGDLFEQAPSVQTSKRAPMPTTSGITLDGWKRG